jgi:hypothetical protein
MSEIDRQRIAAVKILDALGTRSPTASGIPPQE